MANDIYSYKCRAIKKKAYVIRIKFMSEEEEGKEKEENKGKEKKSAETRDYSEFMQTLRSCTRYLQIFSLTLSQLSYLVMTKRAQI